MLNEVAPGVYSWQSKDMSGFRAFAVQDRDDIVLIDPLPMDEAAVRKLAELGQVKAILLTGAYHERDSAQQAATYGVPVYAHPDSVPLCEAKTVQPLPATLPAGLEAIPATGAMAGQTAYYLQRDGGSLIVGDMWHNVAMREFPWPVRLLLKYVIKLRDGLHPMPPSKCIDPHQLNQTARTMLARPVERLLVMHGEILTGGVRDRMLARLDQGV